MYLASGGQLSYTPSVECVVSLPFSCKNVDNFREASPTCTTKGLEYNHWRLWWLIPLQTKSGFFSNYILSLMNISYITQTLLTFALCLAFVAGMECKIGFHHRMAVYKGVNMYVPSLIPRSCRLQFCSLAVWGGKGLGKRLVRTTQEPLFQHTKNWRWRKFGNKAINPNFLTSAMKPPYQQCPHVWHMSYTFHQD